MKLNIKITYELSKIPKDFDIDKIDEIIKNKIKIIGGEWCGEGSDTKIRDICFDLMLENKKT